ncbi:MAG: glycosyltransferase family 1 protein [Candidatus Sphingomonas phytovorans]|nr:glycosyltransferase family 1 protein [Sphingomonas sp.]WEJ99497.1 MAG: glycosyltransferase family 1 protein [Sphingomonas sp.]
MAEDLIIGLPFNLDESWMGGAYYLQNVLSALATLESARQPQIAIITNEGRSFKFMQESGYPKLVFAHQDHILRDPRHGGINMLFAYMLPGMERRTLSWIPDFQEQHLPYLFTETEIADRMAWHRECLKSAGVLLSSNSAQRDLTQFYGRASTPLFVVPFATFLPPRPPLSDVAPKYGLPKRYFFLPNQFWIHKNHIVVLAALRDLAARGVFPRFAFSGKEFDTRASEYGIYLRQLATDWGIIDQIHFLGFMPRDEQLAVMDGAIAVVQPSRFEGWSTVVEDAKALDQHVIASNLDVHREQMPNGRDFFEPSDHTALTDIIERYWEAPPIRPATDYRIVQRRFGEALLNTFSALARANPLPALANADGTASHTELVPGAHIAFNSRSPAGLDMLGIGWSQAEETHVWSFGPKAELWLSISDRTSAVRLFLSGNPHVPAGRQNLSVLVNGQEQAVGGFEHGSELTVTLDCTAAAWQRGGMNRVILSPDPIAMPPEDAGDTRILGVCIWRLEAA